MSSDERIRASLRSMFPGALTTDPIDRSATISLGHVYRSVLVSALRTAAPDAPAQLALECNTWGDVFDWFGDALTSTTVRPFGHRDSTGGARVSLRPVTASDLADLYETACDPTSGYRWRYRGQTPSFDEFRSGLFAGTLCQFMVADTERAVPIGLVAAYNSDMSAGHTYFAFMALRRRPSEMRLAMIEGAALFISFLFRTFPLRRILMELPSYNLPLVSELITAGIATQVGEIVDYYYHASSWYSQVVCEITKPGWDRAEAIWTDSGSKARG